ncbi:MAG: 3-hydroxyacyl-ACP dehydratase FabZ family protein, partial [Planctomycetota bacterium]
MRFFLIDKIKEWHVGNTAKAVKNVALSEDFFDDHFPRRPVMPGVLIIEGMAQLSGLLLEASLKEKYEKDAKAILTVLERTKFRDIVKPGDTLIYTTEIMS